MKNGDTSIHNTGLTKEEMDGVGHKFHQGLTKREYFAAMAMQGLVSDPNVDGDCGEIAKACIKMADALLKALEE